MASVNKINEVLAEVRGAPGATIEAYSRVLRRDGILPATRRGGGATPLNSTHCAHMLFAILRGSPSAAAENAKSMGGLLFHDEGPTFAPIAEAKRAALGWPARFSFAEAVAWLIDRHCDGTISNFAIAEGQMKVEVDRYWAGGTLSWFPNGEFRDVVVQSHIEAFGEDVTRRMLDIGADGRLYRPVSLRFRDPLLFEIAESFAANDTERNTAAHRAYRMKKDEMENYDVWGNEWITGQTLKAIANLLSE